MSGTVVLVEGGAMREREKGGPLVYSPAIPLRAGLVHFNWFANIHAVKSSSPRLSPE